jgi:hypothetical protein
MASIQLSRHEAEEGDLPDVCMCCGAPAVERKRRRFSSYPLWSVFGLTWELFHSNPFSVGFWVLWDWKSYTKGITRRTKYIRCYTLFCQWHKNYWFVRSLFIWASLVVILVLIIGGFFLTALLAGHVDKPWHDILIGSWCISFVVLLLGWLVSIPINQATAIHPANATEQHVILKRVSPAFVEAVRHYRAERMDQPQTEKSRPRPSPYIRKEGGDRIQPS